MAQINNTRIVQECASVQRLDVLHTSGQGYHVNNKCIHSNAAQ